LSPWRVAGALPQCSVLHTDDLARHHGVFSWDQLLINDVLPVLRDRQALHYRPPAWVDRASYARWMAEENAYLAAERPWEYADVIVDGGLDDDQEKKIIFRVPHRPAPGQQRRRQSRR
jgi:hypothetical protein